MSAGASSIHGQFGRRWNIPEEPKASRQRKAHGQFENLMDAKQNMAVEESLKGGAEDGDKPKAGSKLQQALKNGGGARTLSHKIEEQLLKLAETEEAALVDDVRLRLENRKKMMLFSTRSSRRVKDLEVTRLLTTEIRK